MTAENKYNEENVLDAVKKNKLKNINLLMTHNNIPNFNALSRALGIKPTTWRSYQNSLSDKSKVESLLCNYFGITAYEFQNEDLSQNGYLNNYNVRHVNIHMPSRDDPVMVDESDSSLSISAISNIDIYSDILDSCNSEDGDDELLILKKQLIKKYNMLFFTRVSEARTLFRNGDFVRTTNAYDSVWSIMDEQTVGFLKVDDFIDYIYASKIVGNDNGISSLVDKLKSGAFEDKVTLIVANSLEKHFPEYAKKCYLNLL